MPAARHAALALLLAASGLGLPAVPDGRFSFDVYGKSWGNVYNYLTAITGKPAYWSKGSRQSS